MLINYAYLCEFFVLLYCLCDDELLVLLLSLYFRVPSRNGTSEGRLLRFYHLEGGLIFITLSSLHLSKYETRLRFMLENPPIHRLGHTNNLGTLRYGTKGYFEDLTSIKMVG